MKDSENSLGRTPIDGWVDKIQPIDLPPSTLLIEVVRPFKPIGKSGSPTKFGNYFRNHISEWSSQQENAEEIVRKAYLVIEKDAFKITLNDVASAIQNLTSEQAKEAEIGEFELTVLKRIFGENKLKDVIPEQEQEKEWTEARTKKGYDAFLCSVTSNGYSFFGYFIPESGNCGCGHVFIPIEPSVVKHDEFALKPQELSFVIGNNKCLDQESILGSLTELIQKSSGDFQIKKYEDPLHPEKGVQIGRMNSGKDEVLPKTKFSPEKSSRIFAERLLSKTDLFMEPLEFPKNL